MKKLIVYVPGTTMTTKQWGPLITKLSECSELENAEWIGWDHHVGLFSTATVLKKALDLNAVIGAKWREHHGFGEIILIGHSFGGILVRVAYLLGSGCYKNEPQDHWVNSVKSFVLLAAVNRGYDQSNIIIRIYDTLTRILGVIVFRRFLAQDCMAGSEFITDLRMKWIRYMRSLEAIKRPSVCQILGTKDSYVTREDSIDFDQFPNAVHISIPEADHRVLPLIQEGPSQDLRFQAIRDSILGRDVQEKDARLSSTKSSNVVFVLHGIRAANRGWVQSLSEKIMQLLPDCEIVTPSYGYLSALEFAIPSLHRRPIREFQHLYSDYFVKNPEAKFHFVGHSNGTYVLGWSLRALPSMRFEKVVLAGSVLPRDFPWKEIMGSDHPQVNALRNDCANGDVPVGFLCAGLKGLGINDIGTGGYDGFFHDDNRVVQYWYHDGGHSAAVSEANLENIANFIVHESSAGAPKQLVGEKKLFGFTSRCAPWFFRALIAFIVGLAVYSYSIEDYSMLGGVVISVLVAALALKVL